MSAVSETFAERYACALYAYVSGGEEKSLGSAGELGRRAAESGLGALDVVLAHEQSLAGPEGGRPRACGDEATACAAEFLVAALSPFLSVGLPGQGAGAAPGLHGGEAGLRRQIREQSALAEMSRTIGASLDIDEVFEQFAGQVQQVLPFDRIDVVTVDRQQGVFTDLYVYDRTMPGWRQGETRPLGNTLVERITRAGAGTLINDSGLSRSRAGGQSESRTFPARFPSVIGVPLLRRSEVIGALLVRASAVNGYDAADLAFAERIGAQIVGAITSSQLHEETLRRSEETERRVRLDAENRELLRVSEERNRFLSTISHELLTPLTIIRSFVELLADAPNGNLTREQREYLETIDTHSEQLRLTFADLMDVSRISAGAFKVKKTRFDARLLLEEFEHGYSPVVQARRQALETDFGSKSLWFHGDRGRLMQVMSNLVGNASKYSPEGSRIAVRAWPDAERLNVTVRDEGIGISRADQRRLFIPFSRIDNELTRTTAGSGLGLVIAKAIVELHDGQIWIDSEAGAGTTVGFYVRGLLSEGGEGAREGDVLDAGTGR